MSTDPDFFKHGFWMCVIALLIVILTGCGIAKQQMCGPLDMAAGCNAFFGSDTDRNKEQDNRLDALEQAQANLQNSMDTLEHLLSLKIDGGYVQNAINEAYANLAINYVTVNNITNVTTGATIDLLDPCPNVSSNRSKEVIVKITTGSNVEYLAFIEEQGQRHLAKLVTGVMYHTTDHRACNFTLN